ncbi:hypothetical protein ESY86_19405 [Subsaximicrobium wynnwilliamsii]|uniref:Uncharacterized protein n=1 Tax=Subsaximicrobium wynnwilliamsii TaxID=291179 RepID=A0A5C6ZDM2_9FLAO|nr:hypothetical protein [Subsaximicrobium wynnwilliamsii]TXD81023.1 hypothetical protein ESY87_19575 [Subsaximicrobium wynnwilliamsii]TXD86740.1 hypothetical protein ESY86_19405 [Subsaximicrobium wynnwilliamsii]TXE00345.1 hypothetical protein ESY88_19565 [Subsaximicrobium wynnwilliamsii]
MKLFNFIQKKQSTDKTPNQIIKNLIDYLPADYNDQRQLKDSIEFLNQNELGLALDSLIELTEETGHYFSDKYWLDLADAADKMELIKERDFCHQQIRKTETELKFKVSFGSTVEKIDDNHFQDYTSEKIKDNWAKERREKDNVEQLMNNDGLHFKSHGRNGFFYFVDKGKLAEIEYELGVNGLIIWFNSTDNWAKPSKLPLTTDEKLTIKTEIEKWAAKTRNAIELD